MLAALPGKPLSRMLKETAQKRCHFSERSVKPVMGKYWTSSIFCPTTTEKGAGNAVCGRCHAGDSSNHPPPTKGEAGRSCPWRLPCDTAWWVLLEPVTGTTRPAGELGWQLLCAHVEEPSQRSIPKPWRVRGLPSPEYLQHLLL